MDRRADTRIDRRLTPSLLVATCCAVASTAITIGPLGWFSFPHERVAAPKSFALAACALACAAALATIAITRGLPRSRVALPLAAYFTIGALSWRAHASPLVDLLDWIGRDGCALVLFASAAVLALRRRVRPLMVSLLAVATLLSLVALFEGMGVHLSWAVARRPVSLLGNRNFVGAYAAVCLPLAIASAASKPRAGRLALVALLASALVLTRCRSAWLGIAVAAFVAAILGVVAARKRAPGWLARGALAVGAAIVGVAATGAAPWPGLRWTDASPLLSTARRIAEVDHGSGHVRLLQMRAAIAIARDRLLGAGPSTWDDASAAFANATAHPAGDWHGNPTSSSDAARVLAELGAPGLAAVLVAFAIVALGAIRVARRSDRPSPWLLPALASLAAACVHALLDAPMYRAPMIALFAVVAGVVHGLALRDGSPAPARRPRVLAVAMLVAGLGGAVGPTLALTAALRTPTGSALADLVAAQAIYPRVYVSEEIAQTLVAEDRCADAQLEIDRLAAWIPHHAGPRLLRAACDERAPGLRTSSLP